MRAAATFVLAPEPIMDEDQSAEHLNNALIQHFARQASAINQKSGIQFIVSSRGSPPAEKPLLLPYEDKDMLRNFTITKALRELKYPSERLPALRMTSRVMFVRVSTKSDTVLIPNLFAHFYSFSRATKAYQFWIRWICNAKHLYRWLQILLSDLLRMPYPMCIYLTASQTLPM
jgi:hypothetical protein